MQTETRMFWATIYKLEHKSFLCPDSEIKAGDFCISFDPLQRVDPMHKYAFVYTADGHCHSVSRKFLVALDKQKITWERKPLSTYVAELKAKIYSMTKFFSEWKPSHIHGQRVA